LHAVGRASSNEPVFVNIAYRGNQNSDNFVAFVGKGVCFDSGGLDIKQSPDMREMFLDKQGACSVLAAF
jgi:leucyl aminopeptidase